MRFTGLRLATQLLVITIGTAILMIVLLVALAVLLSGKAVQQEGDQRLTALAEATSELTAEPLQAHDTATIQRILAAAVRDDGLDHAIIFAPDGQIVANQTSERVEEQDVSADDQNFALEALRNGQLRSRDDRDNLVDIAVPIVENGQSLGVLLGQSATNGAPEEVVGIVLPQMSAAGLGLTLLAGLVALTQARYIAAPLSKLSATAIAVGQGQLETVPQLRGSVEVSTLADAFSQMVENLRDARAEVAEQQRTLEVRVEERTAELTHTLAELRETTAARDQLDVAIRELSSPVVPVLDGILVMPLIGVIDSGRAGQLIDTLLHAIERHRARMVILDVTGVPIIDSQVARTLLDAAQAVKLLGAQTVLVGLRPELAQTIVGLGLNLAGLSTQADLQSGVSYALRRSR